MEQDLATLVQREEGRAIDEYNYYPSAFGRPAHKAGDNRSPLSFSPQEKFILGYFQNNPDGSFQTPLRQSDERLPPDRSRLVAQLKEANAIFNQKRVGTIDRPKAAPPATPAREAALRTPGLAAKYLDFARSQKPRAYFGQKEKRVEEITARQALNVAQSEKKARREPPSGEPAGLSDRAAAGGRLAFESAVKQPQAARESYPAESEDQFQEADGVADLNEGQRFQVEVAPLQSVFLNDDQIFIFRRIMINNQVYRQGFILRTKAFVDYLAAAYFVAQPMALYTNLQLKISDQGRMAATHQAGVSAIGTRFVLTRSFPSPFSFLDATLTCDQIPQSASRRTLNVMIIILAAVVLMGLLAIYQSARAIADLSERRSQFVSSVTHELKTPLTNIRMYVEMLEQGIARDEEREQEYFRILDSGGARLSRLINNILELSKLEKKQRSLDLKAGTFAEVIQEVESVMNPGLRQEGFVLKVEMDPISAFKYDREAMIQVFINLIENSMKFGKTASTKQITIRIYQHGNWVKMRISDTGPGIPRHALNKIFDEFYRVDNSLTRATRGTGIGLALAKKWVVLMGGRISAANNEGPGCTITISLPA